MVHNIITVRLGCYTIYMYIGIIGKNIEGA